MCRRFALALGLPLGALKAQQTPAVVAGARVRVLAPKPVCNSPEKWPCYREVVGTLASIDSATIVVRLENAEAVNVSRAPDTKLEVSTGRSACSRHRGACVGLGFLGGAAVGALGAWISVQAQGGVSKCGENLCELAYVVAIPAGAVVGTIVGAVVGGGEDWEGADLPARLSVGPDGSGGVRLGLMLPF
jgi:hypothetical protein